MYYNQIKKIYRNKKNLFNDKKQSKLNVVNLFRFYIITDISDKPIFIKKVQILFYFISCQKRSLQKIQKYIHIGQKNSIKIKKSDPFLKQLLK